MGLRSEIKNGCYFHSGSPPRLFSSVFALLLTSAVLSLAVSQSLRSVQGTFLSRISANLY